MHIPGDDQCVISDQDQLTRPDLFVENDAHHTFTVNYFRNTCIDPPLEGCSLDQALSSSIIGTVFISSRNIILS